MQVKFDAILGQLREMDAGGGGGDGSADITKVNGALTGSLELAANAGSYCLELRRRSTSSAFPISCVQEADRERIWTLDIAAGGSTPVSLGSMFDASHSDALTPSKLNRCVVRWDGVNATLKVYDTLDNRALPIPDFLRFAIQRFPLPDYYPQEYITVTLRRTSESAYGVPVFADDEGNRWECTGLDVEPGEWLFVEWRLTFKGHQSSGQHEGDVESVDVFQPLEVMDSFEDEEYEYVITQGAWA